jgi:hypothetical protein
MHAQIIVELEFEAGVGLEQDFGHGGAILGPIVVFQGSKIEVRQVRVLGVVGLDLREIKSLPGRHDLGNERAQCLLALLCMRVHGHSENNGYHRQKWQSPELLHDPSVLRISF